MFSEIPSTVDVCKRALVILIRAKREKSRAKSAERRARSEGRRASETPTANSAERTGNSEQRKAPSAKAKLQSARPPARPEKERDVFGGSLLCSLAALPFR